MRLAIRDVFANILYDSFLSYQWFHYAKVMVVEWTWILSGQSLQNQVPLPILVLGLVFLWGPKPMKLIDYLGMLKAVQVQISFWRVQLFTYKYKLYIKTAEPINFHWLRISFLSALFQQLWKTNCIFSGNTLLLWQWILMKICNQTEVHKIHSVKTHLMYSVS